VVRAGRKARGDTAKGIRVVSGELRVFGDAEALARETAQWLCAVARAATGRFAICCSGGSTPKRLYELLGQKEIAVQFPWERAHWFWGDERLVPHNHPDSNYGMTRKALLGHVPAPRQNIHAVPTEGLTPEQSATAYEQTLREYYGATALDPTRPLFHVVLLGIGDDGHTASLFPDQPTLDETQRWVVAVIGVKSEARITLTYPALDSTQAAVFLAVGGEKRAVIQRARSVDRALPAARVKPIGTLYWFVDRAASP
jgi:6-phosphogluconolactonase